MTSEREQEKKNIDIDISDIPSTDNSEDDNKIKCGFEIDLPVEMINNNRIDQKKKQTKDAEQARKDQIEKEKSDRIAEKKAARKFHKKWAKNYLFIICLISTITSTCVIGFVIWAAFKPNEWAFVGLITLIGMIITLIHTYAYRYIREEIYRK